jgi:homoserine dehydrogenase
VVTANKALLALDGFGLMEALERQKVCLGFEASVCGGIPILRALRNGLVGNRIQSLSGILNGICNYILTGMAEDQLDFETALREAQAKGFTEADPTLDVEGDDAAQKLKILAELAFNGEISADAVRADGIRDITVGDMQAARELGYVIKHVATAEILNGAVSLRTAPVQLATMHQLVGVRHENNAVLVRGDGVGEVFFSGKGAGSLPITSAVLSDVRDCESKHYLRFVVSDPSAIGAIATVLERNGVGVLRAAAVWAKSETGQHPRATADTLRPTEGSRGITKLHRRGGSRERQEHRFASG